MSGDVTGHVSVSESDDDTQGLVVDVGSGVIKAGFAGDDAPRAMFPHIVGRYRYPNGLVGMGCKDRYIGDEAMCKSGALTLSHPIQRSLVVNWDDMEAVMHHVFYNELRVAPEEHPVLMSEPVLNPDQNREKMTQMMFETFNTPGFYMERAPSLSLYSSGSGTGVVLDIGDGVINTLPVYEGSIIKHAAKRIDIGGKDLTHLLNRLLQLKGYSYMETAELENVRVLKEQLSYTAQDYNAELQKAECTSDLEQSYEMPDGHRVTLGKERFMCTEALFNPEIIGKDVKGVHHQVYDTVMETSPNCHRDFQANFIISGGSTMMPGFDTRLRSELQTLFPDFKVKVVAPPERKLSVWIGGSILASLSTFQNMWITKSEYDEEGPNIVHKKLPPHI